MPGIFPAGVGGPLLAKMNAEIVRTVKLAYILANAEKLCRAAGTSLANVVRVQQFHTDLAEFYPAYQVWQQFLPGHYFPFSAVKVPFLPVPGCTVLLELWVYVP